MTGNRLRAVAVGLVLTGLIVVAFAWSLAIGDYDLPFGDVVKSLVGEGSARTQYIVTELRLPRALVAVFSGAAFGASGAIFQAVARNPLASPDIIGITAGASAASVVGIVVLGASGPVVSALAFGGSFVAAAAIYLLSWRHGTSGYRMVLVGIGISAFFSAVCGFLLVRAAQNELQRATVWLTGSLTGRQWEHVPVVAVCTMMLVPVAVLLGRSIHLLLLGDDLARVLGLRIELARGLLILVGVALAATATAASGPITFVAFVAPAIARILVGSTLSILPSALFGALLVLVADFAGRSAALGFALPVGVVTGIFGGAYFIYLLARAGRAGRGG
ncbi:MAG: iron chelate uptake ABC transporter family permease subunit [Microlunatus sp.]